MNEVLRLILDKCTVVYLDDIIIFFKESEQHAKDVIAVLELIRKAYLQIKLRKYKFFQSEIKFLEHKISGEGIRTDEDKIQAMMKIAPPTRSEEHTSELQS